MERLPRHILQVQRTMFRPMRPLIIAARDLMRQTSLLCNLEQRYGEADYREETAAVDTYAFEMIANRAVAMSLGYRG